MVICGGLTCSERCTVNRDDRISSPPAGNPSYLVPIPGEVNVSHKGFMRNLSLTQIVMVTDSSSHGWIRLLVRRVRGAEQAMCTAVRP